MALLMDHEYAGIAVTGAYHKIAYVSGNKNELNVDVVVSKDSVEDAADNSIEGFSFQMSNVDLVHDDGVTDKNYTAQAYAFLKATVIVDVTGVSRDYTTATDV